MKRGEVREAVRQELKKGFNTAPAIARILEIHYSTAAATIKSLDRNDEIEIRLVYSEDAKREVNEYRYRKSSPNSRIVRFSQLKDKLLATDKLRHEDFERQYQRQKISVGGSTLEYI